jgi:hypothetical protein
MYVLFIHYTISHLYMVNGIAKIFDFSALAERKRDGKWYYFVYTKILDFIDSC